MIGVALGDETPETYRTLQNNLVKSGFKQGQPSYGWSREVEGVKVTVEFLCETDQVPLGEIFKPKDENVGTKLGAFNVRGAHLVRDDFIERELEGERLDDGGMSRVTVRIANVLPYTVLKILAFQDRHENKDAYDLIFTLLNHPGGPRATGAGARSSPIADHPQVDEALNLMEQRFRDADQDGPAAYAAFLTTEADDDDARARRRQEAVATVRAFIQGFREGAS